MNKKGNMALAIVAVALALVIVGFFLVSLATRECSSNKDCKESAYCGSDYKCHDYPQQIVVKENSFLSAAIVLGIALILAAYIYRGGKIPFVKKEE
ncbi:MAG: hypothetical protein AB1668_04380 [Nanoarchaeota archaeon]